MRKAFWRAVLQRAPLRWLERMGLICSGIVFVFHEVHDTSAPGLKVGSTAGFLDSVVSQLRTEGWDIVTLDEAMRRLGSGDHSRRFAVLTFDDGYRDVLARSLPILERHEAPFTVYVPTGAPTRELYSWWLGVRALFERHEKVAIAGMEMLFRCSDTGSKMRGYDTVNEWIHQDYRRKPLLIDTFHAYDISLTNLNNTYFMDESELRALARHRLVTIGAHTTSHAALATFDADQARHEITANRTYLEHLVDRPVDHLAYPYGTPGACGPREFSLAAEAGFRSAVTARYGPLFGLHRHHPHALPRVAAVRPDDAIDFPAVIRDLRNAAHDPSSPLIR